MQNLTLPFGFGELDWDDWVYGVVAAFIGGGASAFSAGVATVFNHPTSIWAKEFWSIVSTTFVVAGLLSLMTFLRTKPVPEKKITATTQTISSPGLPTVTIETNVEKRIEQITPPTEKQEPTGG